MTAVRFTSFRSATKNPTVSDVQDVSTAETREKQNEVYLVDVRRPDEWVGEYGHIAKAVLVTLDTLPARIQELPRDQTIVFVCRSGARSAQAAAFAKEQGFSSVFNMKGGMIDWTNNQFEIVEKNGGN